MLTHPLLRGNVNTVPGRMHRKWGVLMFVPKERRELGNEGAREERRLEILFCPLSCVLVFSFLHSENITSSV